MLWVCLKNGYRQLQTDDPHFPKPSVPWSSYVSFQKINLETEYVFLVTFPHWLIYNIDIPTVGFTFRMNSHHLDLLKIISYFLHGKSTSWGIFLGNIFYFLVVSLSKSMIRIVIFINSSLHFPCVFPTGSGTTPSQWWFSPGCRGEAMVSGLEIHGLEMVSSPFSTSMFHLEAMNVDECGW